MRTLRAALAVGATAVMVTVGLLVSAPAGAVELVANPGFESGLAGWTCTAETGSGSQAHTGLRALAGTPNATTAECGQIIPVQAGAAYTLTAWVNGAFVFLGASGTSTGEVSTWTPGTDGAYAQLTIHFTGGPDPGADLGPRLVRPGHVLGRRRVAAGPGHRPAAADQPAHEPTAADDAPDEPTAADEPARHRGAAEAHPDRLLAQLRQRLVEPAAARRAGHLRRGRRRLRERDRTPGAVSFSVDPQLSSALGGYTDANLAADVSTLHARGAKVVLSVGGELGTVSVSDATSADAFATSVKSIMDRFGFDGVDIDLENGVNPTFMGQALHQLGAAVGARLILTLAPQTIDMQSTGGAYFQLALNVRDILTAVHTQYYNSGTMLGCDGKVYAQGTVDFLTALACIQLQGGLRPDQVALGLPASSRAAGGGAVAPSVVTSALTCLAQGVGCGTFHPPTTWPAIRGAMTWSVNWDQVQGYAFANTVAPALDRLP